MEMFVILDFLLNTNSAQLPHRHALSRSSSARYSRSRIAGLRPTKRNALRDGLFGNSASLSTLFIQF